MPKPQSVPAITFSLPTMAANFSSRCATSRGCSTWLVSVSITPGISAFPSGIFHLLPHFPLVRVARIGGFEIDEARVCLQHRLDDVLELDVVVMRAGIVAPAQMQPHFFGGRPRVASFMASIAIGT